MKKNKEVNTEEVMETPPLVPKKKKKKKKWLIVLVVLILIGGVVFFFRKPILNGLRKVPLVGQFIPSPNEEVEELSPEELKVKVNAQEQEISRLEEEVEALKSANDELTTKNESLTEYESSYNDFMAQKAAWDEEVARTNTELFIKQFEAVYPDVAERIYKVLKGEKMLSDEQKKLSSTIAQMDEEQAAKVLERLVSTDSELVKSIFAGMNTDRKALILSSMTEQGAAQVVKLIAPDETR